MSTPETDTPTAHVAPHDTLSDAPLDAAQRLGLARFRAKALALPWLDDALRDGCAEVGRLTRELAAARAAIRDASRCDECGAWATRYHTASARFACDSCAPGDGWADDPHAAALRAAMRAP